MNKAEFWTSRELVAAAERIAHASEDELALAWVGDADRCCVAVGEFRAVVERGKKMSWGPFRIRARLMRGDDVLEAGVFLFEDIFKAQKMAENELVNEVEYWLRESA
jgi:hypothetical protein